MNSSAILSIDSYVDRPDSFELIDVPRKERSGKRFALFVLLARHFPEVAVLGGDALAIASIYLVVEKDRQPWQTALLLWRR